MGRRRVLFDETPQDEAEELSKIRGAALPSRAKEPVEDDDEDPDINDLNNPDVESLAEPPLLGTKARPSDLGYGQEAEVFGRATSPKLYSSAAQFPTAVQFRVWRWENGIPVGLGAIDAEATEEDFVRAFYEAMPKAGQGNFQFRMRPIDIRGQELGKEFTINISEHHATIKQIREAKKREKDEESGGSMSAPSLFAAGGAANQNWRGNPVTGGDIIVNGPTSDAGASYAEEMGRMFEQAVETAEEQNKVLRESLEMERERLREEEKTRAEERVSMAERSANTVEKMMERLMHSDRHRSEEAIKAQQQHSGFMMNTLTQVFSQQQEAARQQADRIREQDALRMQQDREFFERQRVEMEARRVREREEVEVKRKAEREEWESRRLQERDDIERRRKQDNEDWERRRIEERERLAADQRRWEDSRKHEIEQIRMDAARRESESERRREQEKEDAKIRIERERMELETRREQLRQEREQLRLEMEERRVREQQEFDRKMATEREERERRERADRERWERERAEYERKREDERREWERREVTRREEDERRRLEIEARRESDRREMERLEALRRDTLTRETQEAERRREEERREHERRENLRREELQREMDKRKEEMALQMKQMEMQAEKDRQHAERMMEMARIERESQRDAQLQREKMEREAREIAEKERQRQYELVLKEMEIGKERDREHAERMMQLSKMEKSGGLSGITEMLGMDTPEILSKIFGGGKDGEEGSSWGETVPKVLGALAEVAARTMAMKPPGTMPSPQPPRAPGPAPAPQPNMVAIQTPEGVKLIPADTLARLQAQQLATARKAVLPVRARAAEADEDDDDDEEDLPTQSFVPPSNARPKVPVKNKRPEPKAPVEQTKTPVVQPTRSQATPGEGDVVSLSAADWDKPSGLGPTAESEALRLAEPGADGPSASYRAAMEVNPLKRAKEQGIPFSQQRAARRAIRDLLPALENAESSDWVKVVTEALMKEPAIYAYLKGVSVYVALTEAKASPDLAEKTVTEMRKSGLIPAEVPYDETDFARLKKGGAA